MKNIVNITEKTIRMPAEVADKWLAALRSGEYEQSRNQLFKGTGYCCLGVLQKVVSNECEWLCLPSEEWLDDNDIEFGFKNDDGSVIFGARNPWVALGPVQGESLSASDVNDLCKGTFPEIADILETCIERL